MSELNLFMFVTNLCVCLLVGILLPILPILTRKSFLFGIKIPMEVQETVEAKALKKRYITVCAAGTVLLLALAVAQFIIRPDWSFFAVMYFPFLFVALQAVAYIPNWKRAKALKEEKGWVVTDTVFAETKTSHTRGNLSDLPWIWYIIGLILIFISAVIVFIEYPNIPERIPTHWDINMQPDAWKDKSYGTLLMLPVFVNLAILATMWVTSYMFVRAKLQVDPQKPELSFAQHKIYRKRMGHSLGVLAVGLVIMLILLGFMSVWEDFTIPFWLTMVPIIVATIPVMVVSVVSGQGGCKIKPESMLAETSGEQIAQTGIVSAEIPKHWDDRFWALGMFYHNPDDPAYIVEDRFGNNLGLNYSRLPVKIAVILGLAALVAMYIAITVSMHGMV